MFQIIRWAALGALLVLLVESAVCHAVEGGDAADAKPLAHLSVHGTIHDPAGRPVAGARVVIRIANGEGAERRVGLVDPGDVIAEARADGKGKFAIDDAPIDPALADAYNRKLRKFDLVAMADGFGIGWTPIYSLSPTGEIKVTLHAAATLAGRVQDDTGAGLAGAVIKVLSLARLGDRDGMRVEKPSTIDLNYSAVAPAAVADKDGRFRLENLPADHHVSLWAYHADHPPGYFVAAVGPHAAPQPLVESFGETVRETPVHVNPVVLTLRRGPKLRIRVVDHDGNPPQGGKLSLLATTHGRKWQEDALPAEGVVAWAAQSTGPYRVIYVPPPGEGSFCLNQHVGLGNAEFETPKEMRLVLPAGRELRGRVVGEGAREGLAGVTVIWSSTKVDGDWSDATSSKAVTGHDGGFALRVVPGKGRIKLLGNPAGFFIDNRRRNHRDEPGEYHYPVEIAERGPDAPLNLEVPRGLIVQGKVADVAGNPISGIVVAASPEAPIRVHAARAVSDAEGKFEIAGLNPRNDYFLSAIGNGRAGFVTIKGEPSQPWNKSRMAEAVLKLELTVTLTGRVLLAGSPQPAVRLTLRSHGPPKEFSGAPLAANRLRGAPFTSQNTELETVLTDADGRYRLGGLKGGDSYSIEVEPPLPALDAAWPYQLPNIPKLSATAPEEVVLPDMHLRRLNQSLAGVVVTPDGAPVAGARIAVMLRDRHIFVHGSSRSGPPFWTETDVEGRFRLERLPDEPLSLMANIQPKRGNRIRSPARVNVEMNQQDVRIVLDPSLVEEEE